MKITDALKGEHAVFYAQFDSLEQASADESLPDVRAQGALLAAGLIPHAQIEDGLLFTALEQQLGADGPTTAFRAEHDEVEAALSRLPTTQSLEEARELIQEAVHAAREHFAKEEQMLFPMAEQLLDASTLEELGAEWARRRSVVLA